MPHPPLLAGVATTPLPLAPTGSVPAETKGEDAAAPSAAEREGTAASPPKAARVAHYFASDAYVMGALRVGGALRATGAVEGSRRKKDGGGGTGDAGIEGVRAEVSGERAMEAPAVKETVWDRLGEEEGESHDYYNTNIIKDGVLRPFTTRSHKGKARSKIKYYQVYHQATMEYSCCNHLSSST